MADEKPGRSLEPPTPAGGDRAPRRAPATPIEERVVRVAERVLASQRHVGAIDIFIGLGCLGQSSVDAWRQGRLPDLESVTNAGQGKVSAALRVFETWARQLGLLPTEIRYLARTRDHRELRCTSTGAPALERAYRTIWLSPALTDGQRARLIEQVNRPPDLVAISPLRHDWACSACGGTGSFLIMEDGGPKCLACTGLDRLVYLPRGDATLTRRALAASAVSAIVVRFSRARRRYERVGALVEADALTAAADRERGS